MLRKCTAIVAVLVLVLSGCGDSSDDQAVVELPPAGTSRISALESFRSDGSLYSITSYSYGETGLLVMIEDWHALDGVKGGDVLRTETRRYDSYGRVLDITTRKPTGGVSLKATYGTDGRLATTTKRSDGLVTVMRFTWEGDRMTQVFAKATQTFDDGGSLTSENFASISYGADGKIASIEWEVSCVGNDDMCNAYYGWRADGQLEQLRTLPDGELQYHDLHYNDQGRLVEMLARAPMWPDYSTLSRFKYDNRGRPVLIETGFSNTPPGLPAEDFYAYRILRIRWEDLPCQPVFEPQTPPTIDLGIGAASPIGTTLLCSNQLSPG